MKTINTKTQYSMDYLSDDEITWLSYKANIYSAWWTGEKCALCKPAYHLIKSNNQLNTFYLSDDEMDHCLNF